MAHRKIEGLVWARQSKTNPWPAPKRLRGAKALGVRYEKALALAVPSGEHGKWFEFQDRMGRGFCQPDLILPVAGGLLGAVRKLVVLEAKYTWCPEGHTQVDELYKPVLEKVYGLPVVGVQVCKVLTPDIPEGTVVVTDLRRAIEAATGDGPVVLHWLGIGGLGPCDDKLPKSSARGGATLASLGL